VKNRDIYLGDNKLKPGNREIGGQFVEFQNEKFYKISNYNEMPDFFITVVSNSDHWMFLSSNGSLSAGRKNRDNALFPYYPVDKIHDYKGLTGSRTYCIVEKENRSFLWEPFTDESEKIYSVQRNLYKSIYGNKIIFEEVNTDLEISFQYGWYNSEKFGWIRKSMVRNLSNSVTHVDILDGIRNLLPYGVDYSFQNEYSNLLDAYKKSELLSDSKLGLFVLSSIPVDRAEPSEALKATTVWSHGPGVVCGRMGLTVMPDAWFLTGRLRISKKGYRLKRNLMYVLYGELITSMPHWSWNKMKSRSGLLLPRSTRIQVMLPTWIISLKPKAISGISSPWILNPAPQI